MDGTSGAPVNMPKRTDWKQQCFYCSHHEVLINGNDVGVEDYAYNAEIRGCYCDIYDDFISIRVEPPCSAQHAAHFGAPDCPRYEPYPGAIVLQLVCTCESCPEQYDVYNDKGERAGYIRLRHGRFTISYPDAGGELLYAHDFADGRGCFEEDEKEGNLAFAKLLIRERILEERERREGLENERKDDSDIIWWDEDAEHGD